MPASILVASLFRIIKSLEIGEQFQFLVDFRSENVLTRLFTTFSSFVFLRRRLGFRQFDWILVDNYGFMSWNKVLFK
jgi:hypothetical protein